MQTNKQVRLLASLISATSDRERHGATGSDRERQGAHLHSNLNFAGFLRDSLTFRHALIDIFITIVAMLSLGLPSPEWQAVHKLRFNHFKLINY